MSEFSLSPGSTIQCTAPAAPSQCNTTVGNVCAAEHGVCSCDGYVTYGMGTTYTAPRRVTSTTACSNAVFGDPLPGMFKECRCSSGHAPVWNMCQHIATNYVCENQGCSAAFPPLTTWQSCAAAATLTGLNDTVPCVAQPCAINVTTNYSVTPCRCGIPPSTLVSTSRISLLSPLHIVPGTDRTMFRRTSFTFSQGSCAKGTARRSKTWQQNLRGVTTNQVLLSFFPLFIFIFSVGSLIMSFGQRSNPTNIPLSSLTTLGNGAHFQLWFNPTHSNASVIDPNRLALCGVSAVETTCSGSTCHVADCGDGVNSSACSAESTLANTCLPDNSINEIRCCADTQPNPQWSRQPSCSVYAESVLALGGCSNGTFCEAANLCARNGGRLCTAAEIQGGCTKNSGCGHDAGVCPPVRLVVLLACCGV